MARKINVQGRPSAPCHDASVVNRRYGVQGAAFGLIQINAIALQRIHGPLMEPTVFVAASVALLATPGPTNTLLATSGAAIGVRRSIHLLAAELCGYMTAITLLRVLVGPVVAAIPAFEILLRIAVVLYLLHLSTKLWLHGAAGMSGSSPVSMSRVFVTTLLNPKGIIFAFTLLPQGIDLLLLCPWLAALAVQIFTISSAWIVAGAWLRRGLRGVIPPSFGYRASAIALILLAGIVSAHAFK